MKVEVSAVETLREQLEKLPTRTTVTPRELVEKLAPVIIAARARGQDYDAIAASLAAMGVRIKPSTVRNYLWRARRVGVTSGRLSRCSVASMSTGNSESNVGALSSEHAI